MCCRYGSLKSLEHEDITNATQVYSFLENVENKTFLQDIKLPLRRFQVSASRLDFEDHFIDCAIALERLLIKTNEKSEISYRFRLRGAALLPDRYGTIDDRRSLLREIYNLRSAIVHGSAKPEDINNFGLHAESILRDVLNWYIKKGVKFKNRDTALNELDISMIKGGNMLR